MSILRFNRTYRHIRRYQQIIRTLVKYGFDDVLEKMRLEYYLRLKSKIWPKRDAVATESISRPQRVRLACEELGTTFIKLGQLLSSRSDLLPAEYVEEFSQLLDNVAPFPFDQAKQIVADELGRPVEECFKWIDPHSISAASIAQVHLATLHNGDQVVVKIQRPGIAATIEEDILILYDLAGLIERYVDENEILDARAVVDEFARTVRQELDFIKEAHNLERFAANFRGDSFLQVPAVLWEFTSPRVLTMERICGTPLTRLDELQLTPEEKRTLAIRGARATLQAVFEFGFFHADPHPANIFILEDLSIALVDFGMVGILDEDTRDILAGLFRGAVEKDVDAIVRAVYGLGSIDYEADTRQLRRDINEMLNRYHGLPLGQLQPTQIIPELFDMMRRNRVRLPADLSFMGKALMVQNALGRQLCPDFDILGLARPYVRKMMMRRFQPQRQWRDLSRLYDDSLELLRALPFELKTILQKARRGQASIRMEHHGLDKLIQEMDRSSNRITFGLIIAALIIGSSIIMQLNQGPLFMGFSVLGLVGYVIAGVLGLWLAIAIMRSGKL